ncbi:MAG: hypothetical protein ACFNVQ_00935 [Campylobacter sp.]
MSSASKFYARSFTIEPFKFTLCRRVTRTASKIYESCVAKIKFTATPYPSTLRRKYRDRYKMLRKLSRYGETKFCTTALKEFAMKFQARVKARNAA